MGLGIFFVSTLSLLRVLGVFKGLVTPPLLELITFRNKFSLSSHNLDSSAPHIITDFSEYLPP